MTFCSWKLVKLSATGLCKCSLICASCPLSLEKTEWASQQVLFLGVLLDVRNYMLVIPVDKRDRVLLQICTTIAKRKLTIKQIQQMTGLLNFLNRALVPGRAFTRCMYSKISGLKNAENTKRVLKHYHHISLDAEFLANCKIWEQFLENCGYRGLCRPFLDILGDKSALDSGFYSDASGCKTKGFSCFYQGKWIFGIWEPGFIESKNPSIEYLELFALIAGIITWHKDLSNRRIIIHCDNQAVVEMVNSNSSKCKNCMILIRKLVLNNLFHNRRIYVRYIRTARNILAQFK